MKKEAVRIYKISDAALVQLSDNLVSSANRDAAELAAYGVNAGTLTLINSVRDDFSDMPTDEELSADMVLATANRNDQMVIVRQMITQIAGRAKIKYGEENARYRKYGTEQLSRQRPDDLVRVGRRVVRVATEQLADLASEGLTQQMIDNLAAETNALDNLIDVQLDSIKERDLAVNNRIELGNNLYELIGKLAAKGKLCWQDVNEAKYNDYVLTERSNNNSSYTEGTVAAGMVVNLSVTGVNASTVLTVENTGTTDLVFYFAADPTDPTGPMPVAVAAGSSTTQTAADMGYDEALLITRFNVQNPGSAAGAYAVEWN